MASFSPGFSVCGLCGWAFFVLFFFLVQVFLEDMSLAAESFELEKNCQLPDDQVITIGNERFCCPEVLFKHNLIDKESQGIHTTTFNFIGKCDVYIHKDQIGNTVLTGGTTTTTSTATSTAVAPSTKTTSSTTVAPSTTTTVAPNTTTTVAPTARTGICASDFLLFLSFFLSPRYDALVMKQQPSSNPVFPRKPASTLFDYLSAPFSLTRKIIHFPAKLIILCARGGRSTVSRKGGGDDVRKQG